MDKETGAPVKHYSKYFPGNLICVHEYLIYVIASEWRDWNCEIVCPKPRRMSLLSVVKSVSKHSRWNLTDLKSYPVLMSHYFSSVATETSFHHTGKNLKWQDELILWHRQVERYGKMTEKHWDQNIKITMTHFGAVPSEETVWSQEVVEVIGPFGHNFINA